MRNLANHKRKQKQSYQYIDINSAPLWFDPYTCSSGEVYFRGGKRPRQASWIDSPAWIDSPGWIDSFVIQKINLELDRFKK